MRIHASKDSVSCDWTDFSAYDLERGGETPYYQFLITCGTKLNVVVSDYGTEDPPPSPTTKEEALAELRSKLKELQEDAVKLEAFLKLAEATTEYGYQPNSTDDPDLKNEDPDGDGFYEDDDSQDDDEQDD